MPVERCAKAILLWIDDKFHGMEIPDELWTSVFGAHSDRVFRLMDLSIQIATSYEDTLEILETHQCDITSTFMYCILDLNLPATKDSEPGIKYGIGLGKELRKRNIPFAFLSSNAAGANLLNQARLGTIPYYIKEDGSSWKLPETLTQKITSEVRRHITWISLDDIVKSMHSQSDIRTIYRQEPERFRFFPFYGPYRDFIERCEFRGYLDLTNLFAIRSPRKHCDEIAQQAICIILYQTLLRNYGKFQIKYGHGHDSAYLDKISRSSVVGDQHIIAGVRITPEFTSVPQLRQLIEEARSRSGATLFILPNDESFDQYSDLLRKFGVHVIEELPETRVDDSYQREELVRETCHLALQEWVASTQTNLKTRQNCRIRLYPELLINPINWTILLDIEHVPEELSDSYELLGELNTLLNNVDKEQYSVIQDAILLGQPIPYDQLLRVGHETFCRSEYGSDMVIRVEKSINAWLRTSWQFPYNLDPRKTISQRNDDKTQEVLWNEIWQDSCYEILLGMIEEYVKISTEHNILIDHHSDLHRVIRFVKALGGIEFLSADIASVDWDALELMRWPHRQFPMPAAVLRRLRQAGRYLWIRPEGLELATALPGGRLRYRLLNNAVDHYWTTLTWGNQISDKLPIGWMHSIKYLSEIILENRVTSAWRTEPNEVWDALLGLLRNGAPIMFIANQLLGGKSLVGDSDSIEAYLHDIHGYGKILGRIPLCQNE